MREILFKGQRKDNGEWVEGLLWKKKHNGNKIFISYFPDEDDYEDVVVVDPETVGQYTGLTDMNGKKIFEGDICQIKNHILIDEIPFVAEWEDSVYMGWTWRDLDGDGSVDSFTNGVAKNCEVIGNIHDTEGGAE